MGNSSASDGPVRAKRHEAKDDDGGDVWSHKILRVTVKRRPKNGFKEMRKQERRRCLPVLTGPAGHGVADKLYLISALILFAETEVSLRRH